VQGQGIKGAVITQDGEPLPFASVYIRNLQDGVPTNENGRYEFKLAPGLYDVVVQHLGYASQIRTVEIKSDWVTLDFSLVGTPSCRLRMYTEAKGKGSPSWVVTAPLIPWPCTRWEELKKSSTR